MQQLIRTKRHGVYGLGQSFFGSFLKQIDDPDANHELTASNFKQFELRDDVPRIDSVTWAAWVHLCFHCCKELGSENMEVTSRLLIDEATSTRYRILIPHQQVGGAHASADSFDDCVDVLSGEVIPSYPPPGWIAVGSSHSHNTMGVGFSSTDDGSELKNPGLHIIVGQIDLRANTYQINASITADGRRFLVPWDRVIDASEEEQSFAPAAAERIKLGHSYRASPWLPRSAGFPSSRFDYQGKILYDDDWFEARWNERQKADSHTDSILANGTFDEILDLIDDMLLWTGDEEDSLGLLQDYLDRIDITRNSIKKKITAIKRLSRPRSQTKPKSTANAKHTD